MGTRGLTMVKLNGNMKVAQYGQWDHYPTGQGETVCRFFRGDDKFAQRLANKVKYCRFATQQEKDEYNDLVKTHGEGAIFRSLFSGSILDRDVGANILYMIASGLISEFSPKVLIDSSDFWDDTLFCEYVHLIELETDEEGNVVKCDYTIYSGKDVMGKFNMLESVPTYEDLKDLEGSE